MSYANVSLKRRSFGETIRRDAWWLQPLVVFLGLSTFLVYSTWAALQGNHYWHHQNGANYLSPLYSPEIFGSSPHAIFGPKGEWWPSWLLFSPALLILWAPAGFRLTCYYYRGAYYKAFWADPPACAVGEPRKRLFGREFLSAHHAKHSPLFPLPRAAVHSHPCARRVESDVVHGSVWFHAFRHWRWNDCARAQRHFAGWLHIRLSFVASFDWRFPG